jgi:hypothetical protein
MFVLREETVIINKRLMKIKGQSGITPNEEKNKGNNTTQELK